MLSETSRGLLAKICGLFGSDHVGERASAAAKADALARQAGMTWPLVLAPAAIGPDDSGDSPRATSHRRMAAFCHDNLDYLNEWEREFIRSIRCFRRLSDKQRTVLERVYRKCRDMGASS